MVYRVIKSLSKDSASKLVRLYPELFIECRFFDIRKDCLTIESLSLLFLKINKIFHNFLIYRDKQRQSTKFSSASYVIEASLLTSKYKTFTEFEMNFFYRGTIPISKVLLGVISPYMYLTVVT